MVLAVLLALAISAPTFAEDSLSFPGFNLQGDTAYLVKARTLAAGVGTDIASMYNGMITLRIEAVATPATSDAGSGTFVGAGPMINIPKLITRFGGQWQANVINPSVGVMPLYDFNNKVVEAGIVVSVIRITF